MGTTGEMRVSIIVPAYNAVGTIGECLEACLNQTHQDIEVIVVDDSSTDNTPALINACPVTYVRQNKKGPAAARNLGAHHATGEIIAFTDSDCVPDPSWIEELLKGFREGVVAVGGTYGIRNDSSFLARLIHEEIVLRHEQFSEEVDFLGSFNVAFRKEAFDAVGGFDESFLRASGEDNDLAYRLQDEGGTLHFASAARVAHYHPTKLLPYLRTQMRHGFWRMKLYAKHPGRGSGDQYAGLGELAGPPLSLIMIASGAAVLILAQAGFLPGALVMIASLIGSAVIYELPRAARLNELSGRLLKDGHARPAKWLLYPYCEGVLFARDVYRGLGLIAGVWTFFVLRRGAAR